jgi:hypothetical protein
VSIEGGSGNALNGNYIGTDVTGTVARGNTGPAGVFISSSGNYVGGLTATPGTAPGNLISGNSWGVRFEGSGSGNHVLGNIIGLDTSGTAALRNEYGVQISGGFDNHSIGGTAAGSRNVISANRIGIRIQSGFTLSTNHTIQGNYIGTDITGLLDRGNDTGIFLNAAQHVTIGGTTEEARNVISGNGYTFFNGAVGGGGIGVNFFSTGTVIQGNYIGVAANGVGLLGNVAHGIYLERANNSLIGGLTEEAANIIAHSGNDGLFPAGYAGVSLSEGSGNAILRNTFHSNGGLGIDLGSNGVTLNDLGDTDTGLYGGSTNNFQNFPNLYSAITDASTTTIVGALNSTPNSNFRLEFYANTVADVSGFGEGQSYIGFTNVTTDIAGNAGFSIVLPFAVPVPEMVTATATDAGNNTSEFSNMVGDYNDDGRLSCPDLNSLTAEVVAGSSNPRFDLNGDQSIDNQDILKWLAVAAVRNLPPGVSYLTGDANLDRVVDGSDFNIWNANKFTNGRAWCSGNFNFDAVIDGSDFNLWNANKFRSAESVFARVDSLSETIFSETLTDSLRTLPFVSPLSVGHHNVALIPLRKMAFMTQTETAGRNVSTDTPLWQMKRQEPTLALSNSCIRHEGIGKRSADRLKSIDDTFHAFGRGDWPMLF